MSNNPYEKYVEGIDLLDSLEETPRRIAAIAGRWSDDSFGRSHAAGKWTAAKILIHLAQMEMVFANRLRFAATTEGYVAQSFEQDDWMAIEEQADGRTALDAYVALRRMNLALCRRLTQEQRQRAFEHPDFGRIDLNWILAQVAGHERHHLPQLEAIE